MFLTYKIGWKTVSAILLVVFVAVATIPPLLNVFDSRPLRQTAQALDILPNRLEMAGKKLLFLNPIDADNPCADVCGDALQAGGFEKVYAAPLFSLMSATRRAADPFSEVLDRGVFWDVTSGLTENGQLPAQSQLSHRPDVDFTILTATRYQLRDYPVALGVEALGPDFMAKGYFIYEGWPATGHDPIARLITVQYSKVPVLTWPVAVGWAYAPKSQAHRAVIQAWLTGETLH